MTLLRIRCWVVRYHIKKAVWNYDGIFPFWPFLRCICLDSLQRPSNKIGTIEKIDMASAQKWHAQIEKYQLFVMKRQLLPFFAADKRATVRTTVTLGHAASRQKRIDLCLVLRVWCLEVRARLECAFSLHYSLLADDQHHDNVELMRLLFSGIFTSMTHGCSRWNDAIYLGSSSSEIPTFRKFHMKFHVWNWQLKQFGEVTLISRFVLFFSQARGVAELLKSWKKGTNKRFHFVLCVKTEVDRSHVVFRVCILCDSTSLPPSRLPRVICVVFVWLFGSRF